MLPPSYSTYPNVVRDPTDVIGRRIGAFFIDYGVAVIIALVVFFAAADRVSLPSASSAQNYCDRINDASETDDFCIPFDTDALVYSTGDLLFMFGLPLLYLFISDAVLTGITGFSIGKGIVGLRVVRIDDGRLCGFWRSMLRWILWSADGQPCGVPIVGLIVGLASKGHRRVGDLAARTLVVHHRDVGIVPVVPGLNAPPAAPWGGYP
ncbi:MAG TPA: RDD family protein, partial [Acidimicrobiales bacterium]|nr:RDD family protein [Acidimicrobiales bacterium]